MNDILYIITRQRLGFHHSSPRHAAWARVNKEPPSGEDESTDGTKADQRGPTTHLVQPWRGSGIETQS